MMPVPLMKAVPTVTFAADPAIFETTGSMTMKPCCTRLREQAFLNAGVRITFTDRRGEEPVERIHVL